MARDASSPISKSGITKVQGDPPRWCSREIKCISCQAEIGTVGKRDQDFVSKPQGGALLNQTDTKVVMVGSYLTNRAHQLCLASCITE